MTSPQDSTQDPQDVPDSPLDPTLEADLTEALADVDAASAADVSSTEAASGAAASGSDASAEAGADDTVAGVVPSSLEDQLAERTEDLQRLNAEYTNYRRRTERERVAVAEAAKSKVIEQFLPVLDDLELARQHGDLSEGPLKAIGDKLQGVLDAQGLEPFGAVGDAFDPEIHEAVQDLSTGGEQVLGTVLRRGYKVGDKLVRTAMVVIADGAVPEDDPAEPV